MRRQRVETSQKVRDEEGHGSWGSVAHTCNPSYSGGSDQEDCGSKPALGKQFQRPFLKKTHHKKKGLVAWLKHLPSKNEALSSNPSTNKRKKKKKKAMGEED
jgi:hypothetical protein